MAQAEFSEATLMWPSMSDWSPVVAFPKPGVVAFPKPGVVAFPKPGVVAFPKPGVVAFPKPGVALGKRNSLR
jgi:hypothetical protein